MVFSHPLAVGGLTHFSTADYPGYLAAVVFCQGCPWRCTYCHNTHLQATGSDNSLSWQSVTEWLEKRRGLIDAVVLQGGLARAMHQVREMGFRVGLHTAGIYPDRLAGVLPLVDWIGFDIKAPFEDYPRITSGKGGREARRSLAFVLASGKPHEIRCTVDEEQLSIADAERLSMQSAELGVNRLVLQSKRDTDGKASAISAPFIDAIARNIEYVEIR